MVRQEMRFTVQKCNGIVTNIGKSVIYQPEVRFGVDSIKWYEDKRKEKVKALIRNWHSRGQVTRSHKPDTEKHCTISSCKRKGFGEKFMTEEEKNRILREMHNCILNKKPWKGLKRTKTEMNKSLDRYRGWLEKEVKVNMPWEDSFEFSDFATRMIRPEVAIDLAFRLGYLYGNGTLQPDEEDETSGSPSRWAISERFYIVLYGKALAGRFIAGAVPFFNRKGRN